MTEKDIVINQTKEWIRKVVIANNFCPFASKVFEHDRIRFIVESGKEPENCLYAFMELCIQMDQDKKLETGFVIFPNATEKFNEYLHLVSLAESLLEKENYTGIYQVAGFHPLYRFKGAPVNDPANYTNRSVYPMFHILREESIEKAIEKYGDPSGIPDRNIRFAREKGLVYMKMLRDSCLV